jgi:hypothetical protein
MTTKIKRSLVKSFLNTGTLVAPVWSLIADGVTTGKIGYSPKTTEETYIDADNSTISVDAYGPTLPIEATAKASDAVFEYLDTMRKARSIGSDAESEVVNVWLYKTPALGYYLAEKQSCSIKIDDFGGDGGVAAKMNYTINFIGDPVMGEFNPTPTAAFVAAPVNTVLTTMVIGSVTLAPLFATNKAWTHYAGSVSNATTTVTMTSTLSGATILQKDTNNTTVTQGDPASLDVGVNHLTITVTVGAEISVYRIDITRAAS